MSEADYEAFHWVIEPLLDPAAFGCCGNEDYFPFQCNQCHSPYVICFECDALFAIKDSSPPKPVDFSSSCPRCESPDFGESVTSRERRITMVDWNSRDLSHLFRMVSQTDLLLHLAAYSNSLIRLITTGNRTPAGMVRDFSTLMDRFFVMAEALSPFIGDAEILRKSGVRKSGEMSLKQAGDWILSIDDPVDRSFALLGVLEQSILPT